MIESIEKAQELGSKKAQEHFKCPYFTTSAKTGYNVQETFTKAVELALAYKRNLVRSQSKQKPKPGKLCVVM